MNERTVAQSTRRGRVSITDIIWFAVLFVTLLVMCVLVLPRIDAFLFVHFDGSWARAQIPTQAIWTADAWGMYTFPLSGLGGAIPPYQTASSIFTPLYHLSEVLSLDFSVMIYTAVTIETFLVVTAFTVAMGFPFKVGLSAAWLWAFAIMPFIQVPLITMYPRLVPINILIIDAALVILAAFIWIGRMGWRGSILLMILIYGLLLYLVFAFSVFFTVIVPVVAVLGLFQWIAAATPTERRQKGFAVIILSFTAVVTLAPLIVGTTLYSVPPFFGGELLADSGRRSASLVSLGFHLPTIPFSGLLSLVIFWAALFGGIRLLRDKQYARYQRALVAGSVTMQVILLIFGFFMMTFSQNYSGPTLIYFEWVLWPLYILMICLVVNTVRLLRRVAWLFPAMTIVLTILITAQAVQYPITWKSWGAEQVTDGFVPMMAEVVALQPGDAFRGNVATFTGYQHVPSFEMSTWRYQLDYDHDLSVQLGTAHRASALWKANISTVFEANPNITPTYHLMISRMLSTPDYPNDRNHTAMTHPHADYLRSIGTKLVITDFPLDEPDYVLLDQLDLGEFPYADFHYLYQLNDTNVGNYSPTQPIVVDTATDAIDSLQQPSFNFRQQVVVHEPLPELVEAERGQMRVIVDGVGVQGESAGKSLLLLPYQHSHCLQLTVISGDENARLVRANIMQTALLFEGQVDVEIQFVLTPFNNSMCRIQDYREMGHLDIADTAYSNADDS